MNKIGPAHSIHSHSLIALAYHLGLVGRCRRHRCHARDTKRIDYVALGGGGGGWGRRRGAGGGQSNYRYLVELRPSLPPPPIATIILGKGKVPR